MLKFLIQILLAMFENSFSHRYCRVHNYCLLEEYELTGGSDACPNYNWWSREFLAGESNFIWYYSESRLMLSLVNVINRLMWSHFKVSFNKVHKIKTTGYCYHMVNFITFGLVQSDHIKRLPLYMISTNYTLLICTDIKCIVLFIYISFISLNIVILLVLNCFIHLFGNKIYQN